MGDLPTVLDYVRKTANRYTELKPLARLLDALEEGDEATAGLAQERLNRRWGRVGMLAHAN